MKIRKVCYIPHILNNFKEKGNYYNYIKSPRNLQPNNQQAK